MKESPGGCSRGFNRQGAAPRSAHQRGSSPTGRPCLILALAGSECVVSVLIQADIDAEIGVRLAEVRRRCGLTQRQLAKAVGVTITQSRIGNVGAQGFPRSALGRLLTRYMASHLTY